MKQKRNKLFVDSAVQGSLAKRIGLHWLIFFGIVVSLQFLTTWMVNPVLSFGELTNLILQTNGLFLIAVILLLPSFVFDTVKLSNRFAGPMVRLRNALDEAAKSGELKEIVFREGDFWTNMADSYNGMIRKVNERIEAERSDSIQENQPTDSLTKELSTEKTQPIG